MRPSGYTTAVPSGRISGPALYNEERLQLIDALSKSTDAATTIDARTSRRKSYLSETIHWFDGESLKRRSACLGIRRIKGCHTYDVLTKMIKDLHKVYEVVDKREIPDRTFQELRNSTLLKIQLLLNEQTSSSVNSDLIMKLIGKLFIQKNETRWNSE
ncbi:hypothetical protein GHT06_000224 [Daphnia sinensis]|uniref:Uncharacterized protein n=1 Tax=Daphnia sinensis TaxID=1820382 RepID=A0AAD5PPU9_9CRUS|nr:hypothetical protein GHT06_006514 [Daphnia sinensis]KAI9550880.1 hypothetical protein GHT06_000224 [Daphnia sinensis]